MRRMRCSCGRWHQWVDSAVGYHTRCQDCGRIFAVPSMGEQAEEDGDVSDPPDEGVIELRRQRGGLRTVILAVALLVAVSMALSSTRLYWLPIIASAPYGRPRTGAHLVYARHQEGRGRLEIQNVSSHDALVQLIREGEIRRAIYVRSREGVRIHDVPSGEYVVQFSLGLGWNTDGHRFERYASYAEFVDPLSYPIEHGEGVSYEIRLDHHVWRSPKVKTLSEDDFLTPRAPGVPGLIEL